LQTGLPLAIPIADNEALFPLTMYRLAGGPVQEENGHVTLDSITLTQVLSFTLAAEQSGVMPNWLTLYETYDQSWQVYIEGKTPMTVGWLSRYLRDAPADSLAVMLPTPDGARRVLTTGWVWSITSQDTKRQQLAAQLATFLTEPSFLAEWCAQAGYLPPRPSALSGWSDPLTQAWLGQLAQAAAPYPAKDVLTVLKPVLKQALLEVFKLQLEPDAAAQQAAEGLRTP